MNLIDALMQGYVQNLRYVNRFSTGQCRRYENVAEHSYYVALFATAIADWLHVKEPSLALSSHDYQLLLKSALLHDLEESRTGDIHRPFKHSHPSLRSMLTEAGDIAMQQVASQVWSCSLATRSNWTEIWRHAKTDGIGGHILTFADFLSVLAYVLQEGHGARSRLNLETFRDHARDFDNPVYDFIRPLVTDAQNLVREIFAGE